MKMYNELIIVLIKLKCFYVYMFTIISFFRGNQFQISLIIEKIFFLNVIYIKLFIIGDTKLLDANFL